MRLDEISAALRALDEANLLRLPESPDDLAARRGWIDFASNDYLGLAGLGPHEPDVSRETLDGRSTAADSAPWAGGRGAPSAGAGAPPSQYTSVGHTSSDGRASTVLANVSRATSAGAAPDLSPTGGVNVSRATFGDGEVVRARAAPVRARNERAAPDSETEGAGGSGASRLVFGTHSAHLAAEAELADWLGYEAALCFSSGYAANVGALGALLSPEDCVVSDELNHASLIDGIRLSRARPTIVPHLDLEALEAALHAGQGARARWVVLESYSSMDGDGPDLARVRQLCDRYDAHLYLDEAHGVGLFGPEGRGRAAEAGVRADVLMAGLGKAVGAQGGAVLGSSELCTWLWNRARSFVFSTAPAPLTASVLRARIARVRAADAERGCVQARAASVRGQLTEQGFDLGASSFGPILGLRLGEAERALRWAAALREAGFLAQAIRPPTVPPGGSRLRLTLRAAHRDEDVARLIACLRELRDRERAP